MKYLVLIAYRPGGWEEASDAQRAEWMDDHNRFHATVGSNILAGEALAGPEAATTLRHQDGQPSGEPEKGGSHSERSRERRADHRRKHESGYLESCQLTETRRRAIWVSANHNRPYGGQQRSCRQTADESRDHKSRCCARNRKPDQTEHIRNSARDDESPGKPAIGETRQQHLRNQCANERGRRNESE